MPPLSQTLAIDLTQTLVRIPGEAGQEAKIASFLLNYLPKLGFHKVRLDRFGSVIAHQSGGDPGNTLLLDAHIDTVGIAPGIRWRQDPYGAEVIGSRIYGRGTSDMKGALAAMITAINQVDWGKRKGELVLSASVMEEVLEGAALASIMAEVRPDFVIIGEASELQLVHAGRGRAELILETTGRPAHSSSPQHGLNAVEAMIPVLQGITKVPLPAHPVVGEALMVLTDIISEPYPGHSVIPTRCRATFDRRLIPGESLETILAAYGSLETLPEAGLEVRLAYGEYVTYTGESIRQEKWFPAWILPQDHPFLRLAAAGLEAAGLPVVFGSYNFCTNAAYSMGIAGVPTLGFGPSSEKLAHITDEYIEIEQLLKATHGYQALIEAILS